MRLGLVGQTSVINNERIFSSYCDLQSQHHHITILYVFFVSNIGFNRQNVGV